MKTRSADVAITWNGVEATEKVNGQRTQITYTDSASGEADSLDISIHDRDRKWIGAWFPHKGDTLTAKVRLQNWDREEDNRVLDCGSFTLDSFDFSGWPITGNISAVSVPADSSFRETERTKTWENVTIREIGEEIARRAGITLFWDTACENQSSNVSGNIKKGSKVTVRKGAKTYMGGGLASFVYSTTYTVIQVGGKGLSNDRIVIGINGVVTAAMNINDLIYVGESAALSKASNDILINSIEQSSQTDCEFLMSLCETYGFSMKVYAKKIIIFDQEAYKNKKSVATLCEKDLISWSWQSTLAGTYTGGEFTYTKPKSGKKIVAKVGGGNRILKKSGKADSTADAERKIKAAVDSANHKATTMSATIMGNARLFAGQCVDIEGLGKLSGKYYIDKITHSIGNGYTMQLDMSKI